MTDNVTTHSLLLKIEKLSGEAFLLTNHDRDIIFENRTYSSQMRFDISNVENRLGLSADSVELHIAIDSGLLSTVAFQDLSNADVELILYDWEKGEQVETIFVGEVANLEFSEIDVKIEVNDKFASLESSDGRRFHRECDAKFGDQRCGIDRNLAEYSAQVCVLAIHDWNLTVTTPVGFEARSFSQGSVIFRNKEYFIRREFVNGQSRILQILDHGPSPIKVGDEIQIIIGCDKSFSCCSMCFHNAVNFCGFPYIPSGSSLEILSD